MTLLVFFIRIILELAANCYQWPTEQKRRTVFEPNVELKSVCHCSMNQSTEDDTEPGVEAGEPEGWDPAIDCQSGASTAKTASGAA